MAPNSVPDTLRDVIQARGRKKALGLKRDRFFAASCRSIAHSALQSRISMPSETLRPPLSAAGDTEEARVLLVMAIDFKTLASWNATVRVDEQELCGFVVLLYEQLVSSSSSP